MVEALPPASVPSADELAVWFHYEEVAMHFNEILIQFRLQLLGGAGSLATVALYLIGEKVHEIQRPRLRTLASTALLTLVFAAAMFDLGYYNQLLRGAVDALLEFERQHPSLYLSTKIEVAAGGWPYFIYGAYGLVLLVIGTHCAWSWSNYLRGRKLLTLEAPAHRPPDGSATSDG